MANSVDQDQTAPIGIIFLTPEFRLTKCSFFIHGGLDVCVCVWGGGGLVFTIH